MASRIQRLASFSSRDEKDPDRDNFAPGVLAEEADSAGALAEFTSGRALLVAVDHFPLAYPS